MWLSLIVALLTYLMSPTDTKEQRRKALTNAALAGGATYAITEYTDWGRGNLKPIDGDINKFVFGNADVAKTADSKGLANGVAVNPTLTNPGKSTPSTLWDKISDVGPAGIAAIGVGGAALTGNPGLLIAGLAIGGILLLK